MVIFVINSPQSKEKKLVKSEAKDELMATPSNCFSNFQLKIKKNIFLAIGKCFLSSFLNKSFTFQYCQELFQTLLLSSSRGLVNREMKLKQ